jgi:Immunity protein 71/Immunity protein 72
MGLLDFLKTKWSAGEMTEEDRKKIFWYLKRKTSYTAWKREADAFDRFADIFERQVIEEPIAAPVQRIGPMNWETSYPEILKCQVLYEKALAQLKQGDRSVFLYNERGLFIDAANIAGSWYMDMVNEGYHGDKRFDGKYVSEMTGALKDYSAAARNTGYVQPQMAEQAAALVFDKAIYENIPFPSFLAEVPEPVEEVLVRTDEVVPTFGIYEPQIKDGCMNYLLGSTTAPVYSMLHRRPVTWRLIWEDTRYLDGHISNEEALYFPPQAMVEAPETSVTSDLISASTGQLCPKSGNWAVMNDLQGKATLNKGDKMPEHQGRDVVWVWGG